MEGRRHVHHLPDLSETISRQTRERTASSEGRFPYQDLTILPLASISAAPGLLGTLKGIQAAPVPSQYIGNVTLFLFRKAFAAARSSKPPMPTTRIFAALSRANCSSRGAAALHVPQLGAQMNISVGFFAKASFAMSNDLPVERSVTTDFV